MWKIPVARGPQTAAEQPEQPMGVCEALTLDVCVSVCVWGGGVLVRKTFGTVSPVLTAPWQSDSLAIRCEIASNETGLYNTRMCGTAYA